MNKKVGVIITILVIIGAGAKFANNYMRMQRDSSSNSLTQLLDQSEVQKAKNQVSEVFKTMESKNYQLAINQSNELIERYKDHSNLKVRDISLIALAIRAENRVELSQFEDAEKDFKNFIKIAENNSELKSFVTSSQLQMILMQIENDLVTDEEAIIQIDQYLAKYGQDNSLQLKNTLMLGVKGSLERRLKLFDQATISFQNTEKKLMEMLSTDPENTNLLSLLNAIKLEEAEMLAEQDKTELAIELLGEIRTKDRTTDNASLLVDIALTEGYISLITAKISWNQEEQRVIYIEKAMQAYKDAAVTNEQLSDVKEKQKNFAVILADEAYLAYLIVGNEPQVQDKLVEAFKLEGKKLYKDVLRGLSLYPVEGKDKDFQEVVDLAWEKSQESQ